MQAEHENDSGSSSGSEDDAHGGFAQAHVGAEGAADAAPGEEAVVNPKLLCRMYENPYPEVNDLVMVSVKRIAEMGAYVSLLEYNGIEGMVLLSELSRRRIRSVHRLIRVGKTEVVVVLRVDRDKGYIDLSKRRVSPEEVERFEERYAKSKTVHSILRHVAEVHDMELEALYRMVGWPLYRRFGHAYDAFKLALTEPERVWASFAAAGEPPVPADILRDLTASIVRRLTPQKVKLRADVEVACFAYEGIEAVRAALTAGEAVSTPEVAVRASLVAPPLYVLSTQCMDKAAGLAVMQAAVDEIERAIKAAGGHFVVKMKPKAVSLTDEKALDALMKKSELDNTEEYSD